VLAAENPVAALGRLGTAWRRALGCAVIGVTGSTGKTSTKDILAALLSADRPTVASRANFNTDIGMPLAILEAPAGTGALVLEMGMRGPGEIAELVEIAEPDVALVTNIGPVHLERLGSIEAIAAAKAELVAGLPPGATAVVPMGEPLLEPHRRADVDWVTFGPGGDVSLVAGPDERGRVTIDARGEPVELELSYTQAYNVTNTLAAVAAARAAGAAPAGRLDVAFSALRGQRLELPDGVVVINDCYNANPMSMRAALDDLAASASGRRVAVLGDMLELGPDEARHHEEIGRHAAARDVELLITVGPLAAVMAGAFPGESQAVADADEAAAALGELLAPGDTVLVKGSRGVGLEVVAEALQEEAGV
jgi:UDP-N-acetylmuramoyl-tripeptide--D-alanyl-D-alanine ligase